MYERMMADSRAMELDAMERTIRQRMEWEEWQVIERLERALSVAKSRLHFGTPAPQAG